MRAMHRLYGLLVVAALAGAVAPAAPAGEAAGPLVQGVDAIGISVGDMDRALAFYAGVLGFEPVSDHEIAGGAFERLTGVFGLHARVVRLRLGDEFVELIQYLAPEGRPVPVDSRSNDRWFQHIAIVTGDMDRAYAWLRRHKVRHASTGPQTLPAWNAQAAGIRAFYFKDPDGHPLEILQFPPDKGAAKWHRPGDERLFRGIDHTAIVVADTETSLALYRGRLGLDVVGESENYGTEQEHLNNVFGARLRITTLRAPAGPGIELLEYLTPRDGRSPPADSRANDLWHVQVKLVTTSAEAAFGAVRAGRYVLVSPGVTALPDTGLVLRRGAMLRDPDGHALLLAEP